MIRKVMALGLLLTLAPGAHAAKLPAHFEKVATADAGGGLRCVAGVVSKDDEEERAYVYLEDAASHAIRWVVRIARPPNFYENWASHCIADGSKVYALVQSHTNRIPVWSQTFVSLVVLDKVSGHIDSNEFVQASEAHGAVTLFVYEGADSLRIDQGKIVVKGEYGIRGDGADTRTPFTFSVPAGPADPTSMPTRH